MIQGRYFIMGAHPARLCHLRRETGWSFGDAAVPGDRLPETWQQRLIRESLRHLTIAGSLSCFVSFTMMSQAFNLKFVSEVEKFPVLYDFNDKGYNKKHKTEKAWNHIAKEVNLSVVECKTKWKNLRSVFVRKQKPGPRSSSGAHKNPYYLSGAMAFTLPFIRTGERSEGNFSEAPEPQTTLSASQQSFDDCLENAAVKREWTSEEEVETCMDVATPVLSDISVSSQAVVPDQLLKLNMPSGMEDSNYDSSVAKEDTTVPENKNSEAKKLFLLSLLPEIEPMTEAQMRLFRRGVLRLIDDICDSQ